jgi:hypothetical protein
MGQTEQSLARILFVVLIKRLILYFGEPLADVLRLYGVIKGKS